MNWDAIGAIGEVAGAIAVFCYADLSSDSTSPQYKPSKTSECNSVRRHIRTGPATS